MLPKIVAYPPSQIQPIADEAAKSFVSKSAWVAAFLSGVSGLLSRNPKAYRAFGPFWWPLKSLLVEHGFAAEAPDPELVAQATLGSADLDCAAAFAFSEYRHDEMSQDDPACIVDAEGEDGEIEALEYTLWDEEMEGRMPA